MTKTNNTQAPVKQKNNHEIPQATQTPTAWWMHAGDFDHAFKTPTAVTPAPELTPEEAEAQARHNELMALQRRLMETVHGQDSERTA